MTLPHRHWIPTRRKRKPGIAEQLRMVWDLRAVPIVLCGLLLGIILGTVIYQVGFLRHWW